MIITDIRVKFPDLGNHGQLLAFVEVELDKCLVIHDMRVIQGTHGEFVAMPDRKIKKACPGCVHRNELMASFCNRCGTSLEEIKKQVLVGDQCKTCQGLGLVGNRDDDNLSHSTKCEDCEGHGTVKPKLHVDVVHPIDYRFRHQLQGEVLKAYRDKVAKIRLNDWKTEQSLVG